VHQATVDFQLDLEGDALDDNRAWSVIDHITRDGPASVEGMLRTTRQDAESRQLRCFFSLSFPLPALGGDPRNALPHLASLLAGDLIPTTVHDATGQIRITSSSVTRLVLSNGLEEALLSASHGDQRPDVIGQVRRSFRLDEGRPLLAHTFKPRILREEQWSDVEDVLDAGFDLVEPDTRDINWNWDPDRCARWVVNGGQVGGNRRRTAFAPNLSGHSTDSLRAFEEVLHQDARPVVVKIDAGLTGLDLLLSAAQAAGTERSDCVITCYPLLNRNFSPWLGPGTWWRFAVLCGADVIYPGSRPSLPQEPRPIWAGEPLASLRSSVHHYDRIVRQRWAMPTLAGGVHAGQLQVMYELMGPDVAYFLGSPVNDHARGRKSGAKLCAKIIEESVERSQRAQTAGNPFADALSGRLITEIEDAYPAPVNSLTPDQVFGPDNGLQTFYRRSSA
jgi:hypothetical protein